VALAAAQAVAHGFEPWEYFGYTRRQYRRIRELDSFLRRAAAPLLDETGLGLRLRFLSGGMSPAARLTAGKVLPERSGYYPRPSLDRELPHGAGAGVVGARRAQEFKTADGAGLRDPDRMSPKARAERRQNRPLREVLDDLLGHAREIARRAKAMTPGELDYAQQRLEWLADEVWRVATGEAPPP